MVNIKLDDIWNLESDSRQWILSKNGVYIYFFQELSNAIKSYFELKVRGSDAKTISGLLEYHKYCLNTLQRLLEPFKIHFQTNIESPKELPAPASHPFKAGDVQTKNQEVKI